MNAEVEKVIVAVHGIGDQTHFATVQQVLAQFSRYRGKVAAVPLGHFASAGNFAVFTSNELPELRGRGFAEVYWAGIPREVVEKKYVLEDIQPWVRTIVGRIHRRNLLIHELSAAEERMVEQVLGEMLQTINVLDRLCFLAGVIGIFKFDLKKVLVDYLDDVQIVAEFREQGGKIGEVFAEQMAVVDEEFKNAEEIYIVAHSEGTVVALLGLLTALCHSPDNPWISKVRGLMTFGSPIDKHLILWPELFAEFKKPCHKLDPPIEWHNYYDYGDPIGFELETARQDFATGDWEGVFHFPADNDHGFARYPLPGKAHNDYWQDEEVFGHFIQNVVEKESPAGSGDGDTRQPAVKRFKKSPPSKLAAWAVSSVAPYLGALALLFCAVLILYKAVHGLFLHDGAASAEGEIQPVFSMVGRFTCLLAGVTVLARIPRLTRIWYWRLFGWLFFLLSIGGYWAFYRIDPQTSTPWPYLGVAVVLVAVTYTISALVPRWGMRALLVPGSIAVAYVVYDNLKAIHGAHGSLWPVFLAGAVFLYLWWLVALLFDLTFVWHRYIRQSLKIFKRQVHGAEG